MIAWLSADLFRAVVDHDNAIQRVGLSLHLAQIFDVDVSTRMQINALDAALSRPDKLQREPIEKPSADMFHIISRRGRPNRQIIARRDRGQ